MPSPTDTRSADLKFGTEFASQDQPGPDYYLADFTVQVLKDAAGRIPPGTILSEDSLLTTTRHVEVLAKAELLADRFREKVEAAKERITREQGRSLWKRIFPYRLRIERD
jgi:hypothetical protein